MGVKVDTGEVDKNGNKKMRPKKLSRFRFTSNDVEALNVIAAKYGGEVTPWNDGPTDGLHEVTVTQAKIPVVLPPDPLGGSPIYEHWSGGGCLRRCDGIDCTLALADNAKPDAEPAVVPCPCRAENRMICKPKTRLNVVLREVPFGGTWRLESTGWNAAEELPGMVEMVMRVQEIGMVCGELSIEERKKVANGRTSRYVVPALSLPESIDALAAGEMRMGALGKVREIDAPAAPQLEPAPEKDWYDEDDEIHDAEIVPDEIAGVSASEERSADPGVTLEPEEGPPDADTPRTATPAPIIRHGVQSPTQKALHAALRDAVALPEIDVEVDDLRHALVHLVTNGNETSSAALTDTEATEALRLISDLLEGTRRYLGIRIGRLRLSAKKEDA